MTSIRPFDLRSFRAMLDDPVERAGFAAAYPFARSMFEEYLEATRPTFPEFPTGGVTALQFTLFENPEPNAGSSRRRRITKTRYGLNLKAWDRLQIDWKRADHLAWEANAFLWRAEEAREIVADLVRKGLADADLLLRLQDLQEMTDSDGFYGFFLQRSRGAGSRWTDVLFYMQITDSHPEMAFVLLPGGFGYEAIHFEQFTPNGTLLGAPAVAQARIAFAENLFGWSNQNPN